MSIKKRIATIAAVMTIIASIPLTAAYAHWKFVYEDPRTACYVGCASTADKVTKDLICIQQNQCSSKPSALFHVK